MRFHINISPSTTPKPFGQNKPSTTGLVVSGLTTLELVKASWSHEAIAEGEVNEMKLFILLLFNRHSGLLEFKIRRPIKYNLDVESLIRK
ncbi:MAG: hypothetical protein ACTS6G_03635 [Candidatus Hodgkinia cicadicola]